MKASSPRPPLSLVIATHVALGLLLLCGIAITVVLPVFSADVARTNPEYAWLRAPLLLIALAGCLVCLAALVMIAVLVQRIYRGSMLSRGSLRAVDLLVALLASAAGLIIVGMVVMGQAGSIVLAYLTAAAIGFIALACITLVLRSLLHNAINMRDELDVVV